LPFRYFQSPTYGFIGDVYTEIQFRSLGIATRLSQDAMLWLQSKEIKMVRLLASETGRSIYEKLGFVPTDEMVFTFTR
jgi:predicted GNAT family acetyltransferase